MAEAKTEEEVSMFEEDDQPGANLIEAQKEGQMTKAKARTKTTERNPRADMGSKDPM